MDASRTTHQLEEAVDAFQKQKLKDLQVGALGPVLEVFVHTCRSVYLHVCACVLCVCELVPLWLWGPGSQDS